MARKIVKPTRQEQKIIKKRLAKKYPQQYGSWVQKLKGKVRRLLKPKPTVRTKHVKRGLKQAGLTQKDIERLRNKR